MKRALRIIPLALALLLLAACGAEKQGESAETPRPTASPEPAPEAEPVSLPQYFTQPRPVPEALELPECPDEKPYFYKTQVEKAKAIQRFLVQHVDENFTQEELSKRFDFPLTPMKRCFKSVFGTTIGNWLLQYRMNQAAVLLGTKRNLSVMEIAGLVGYDSPSKFAMAFRRVMGLSPTEYRNRIRL